MPKLGQMAPTCSACGGPRMSAEQSRRWRSGMCHRCHVAYMVEKKRAYRAKLREGSPIKRRESRTAEERRVADRIRRRALRYAHPERDAQYHPDGVLASWARAADGTVTKAFVRELLSRATHCPLCDVALDWNSRWRVPSLDHRTPISRGGAHSAANLHVVCLSCNERKGDRTLEEYAARRRRPASASPAFGVSSGPFGDL